MKALSELERKWNLHDTEARKTLEPMSTEILLIAIDTLEEALAGESGVLTKLSYHVTLRDLHYQLIARSTGSKVN